MPKVICPCIDCKYNDDNHRCKANYLRLKFHSLTTVYEGRMNVWVCDKYELSEDVVALKKELYKYFNDINENKGRTEYNGK